RLAAKAHLLRTPDSPPDALPLIGAERQIERAPAETDAQYRARLLAGWTLWGEAGTPSFAANALAPFGVPESAVTVRYTPDGWQGDLNVDNWSRFWVILTGPDLPWEILICGTGWRCGDDITCGTTARPVDVAAIRRFMRKWKAGHEIGVRVIFAPLSQV